jgi:hypothetical protein
MNDYNRKRLDEATAMLGLVRDILWSAWCDMNRTRGLSGRQRREAEQKLGDITAALNGLQAVAEDLAEARKEGMRL